MKKVYKPIVVAVMMLLTVSVYGQNESSDSPWSIGADVFSRYIWRGINLGGPSPSIQPYIEYGFGNDRHAFAVGAWGAYSLSGAQTGQEADLYLSYTYNGMLSITATDYFFPNDLAGNNAYFNYNMDWDKINLGTEDQTGHVLELALAFNGTENLPLTVMFAMNVWGADSRSYTEQGGVMVPEDKIVMSKYVELGYAFSSGDMDVNIFAGACLDNPDTDAGEPTGFYGQEKAGLINLGVGFAKSLQVTNQFELPVSASLITNPEAQNIFLVFGFSF